MSVDELDEVASALHASDRLLMVGFNRRHAPLALQMKDFFATRAQPAAVLYRANVGYRPPEHWLHDPRQGGGVIIGEACHHIDFCNWFVGAPVESVAATCLAAPVSGFMSQDNVSITIRYGDGSVAHVAYLSNGSKAFSIERVEVFADNRAAAIDDYRRLDLGGELSVQSKRLWTGADRGHANQLRAFLAAVADSAAAPVDSAGYLDSTRLMLQVAAQIGMAAAAGESVE
jgi:predicted dehydrogenase